MNLAKARKEAETIARYADRIERSDPTGHVAAMGYAARHILSILAEPDASSGSQHQTAPGLMTFTTLRSKD